ncbi:MAG: response regulator receiver protein, partial [Brevundimonas sp.]|nr:response regulator receiver protein [Brevundimonas sp.]
MWRIFLIAILLIAFPVASRAEDGAQPVGAQDWESCRGEHGVGAPTLHDCRPVEGVIDPQGRELWLRSVVQRPAGVEPAALYVVGVA